MAYLGIFLCLFPYIFRNYFMSSISYCKLSHIFKWVKNEKCHCDLKRLNNLANPDNTRFFDLIFVLPLHKHLKKLCYDLSLCYKSWAFIHIYIFTNTVKPMVFPVVMLMWQVDQKDKCQRTDDAFLNCPGEDSWESFGLQGNQPWIFTGRTDAKAKAPILWPPDVKSQQHGKDLMLGKVEGKMRRGQQRMKWLHSHH